MELQRAALGSPSISCCKFPYNVFEVRNLNAKPCLAVDVDMGSGKRTRPVSAIRMSRKSGYFIVLAPRKRRRGRAGDRVVESAREFLPMENEYPSSSAERESPGSFYSKVSQRRRLLRPTNAVSAVA
jgi:hypothetical protein